MQLIPSIDLRRGQVVRLAQGRDAEATVYAVDPLEVLARFQAAGVERVHIVDLDAAFGEPRQEAALAKLLRSAKREKLQLGGGLRTADLLRAALESGFDRVVVGSMVVRDPAELRARSANSFLAADSGARIRGRRAAVQRLECGHAAISGRFAAWSFFPLPVFFLRRWSRTLPETAC